MPTITVESKVKAYLAKVKKLTSTPDIQAKLDRLTELNIRSTGGKALGRQGPLTEKEEAERRFLQLTLPHANHIGEIEEIYNILKKK